MSEIVTLEDMGLTANEILLMRRAADLLERHYPGHAWLVGINGGIMDIKPMSCETGRMVYSIRHLDSYSASDLDRKVLNAGGAWLEVLRQRRGAVDHDSLNALPTDRAGRIKLEV